MLPVGQVGDRAGGLRQVAGRSAAGSRGGAAMSDRPRVRESGPPSYPIGGQQIGARLLDLGEVVVPRAHLARAARRWPGGPPPGWPRARLDQAQRPVQADQRLERVGRQPRPRLDRREAQRLERRRPLGPLQLDLEGGPPARRLRRSSSSSGRPSAPASVVSSDSLGSRLPFSISDKARRRCPGRAAPRRQRQPGALAQVPEPAAERQRVRSGRTLVGSVGCDRTCAERSVCVLTTGTPADRPSTPPSLDRLLEPACDERC